MSRPSSRSDPTTRFSDRVEDYVRYRPDYPNEVALILKEEGVPPGSVLADLGSGTGISAELFLRHGYTVVGVEPNPEMRRAAEKSLAPNPRFRSVAASAEDTTLASGSVDAVVAAQAFHWFDRTRTRRECLRILKPNGRVMLVWNERRVDATPFLAAYEKLLLQYGTDYRTVDHRNVSREEMAAFFGTYRKRVLSNGQVLDRAGFRGRVLSSSYVPAAGEPGHEELLEQIEAVFGRYEEEDSVHIEYDTVVYVGSLLQP